jgi:radical SAM superfamily enzyme YgiQ (UPF0313 family)
MKILLIEPPRWNGWPVMRADRCERPAMYGGIPFPYWLASTASFLKENGVEVDLLDANALDSTWEKVKEYIKKAWPEIVLFSGANSTIDHDLNTANVAKSVNKGIITAIVEPILAPQRPQEILSQCPDLDVIFIGEPENIAFQLCEDKFGADGIIYREKNKIRKNPPKRFDISDLSMPAYELLPMRVYSSISVRMSRGCPYRCTFCTLGSGSENSGFDKKLRFRRLEKVIEELGYLSNLGVKMISFADETFTINNRIVTNLCDEIIKRGINLNFTCQTRPDVVKIEVLRKMKQAGCFKVGYGIESGDDQILAWVKKDMRVSQIREAFELTREARIKTSAFNIIGLPGETKETAQKTIALNKEIKPDDVQFATATPVIGTEFWDYCVGNGYLTVPERIAERAIIGTHAYVQYENLKPKDIYNLIKKGLLEINFSYLSALPPGLLQKSKFVVRRAITAYRLYRLPKSDFPGKTSIEK